MSQRTSSSWFSPKHQRPVMVDLTLEEEEETVWPPSRHHHDRSSSYSKSYQRSTYAPSPRDRARTSQDTRSSYYSSYSRSHDAMQSYDTRSSYYPRHPVPRPSSPDTSYHRTSLSPEKPIIQPDISMIFDDDEPIAAIPYKKKLVAESVFEEVEEVISGGKVMPVEIKPVPEEPEFDSTAHVENSVKESAPIMHLNKSQIDILKKKQASARIVIVGGGIMGASCAYYLNECGYKNVTIVEKLHVACAASGKAAGFLSRTMCRDTEGLRKLSMHSFDLHCELAEKLKGEKDYGFRHVIPYAVSFNENAVSKRWGTQRAARVDESSNIDNNDIMDPCTTQKDKKKRNPSSRIPYWLEDEMVKKCHPLGTRSEAAQVHPGLFTKRLVNESGAKVIIGEVNNAVLDPVTHCITHVEVAVHKYTPPHELEAHQEFYKDDKNSHHQKTTLQLECDYMIMATGPWTSETLENIQLHHLGEFRAHRANSVVMTSNNQNAPQMIFGDVRLGDVWRELEFYTRPDNTLYLYGNPRPEDEEERDPSYSFRPPSNPADIRPCLHITSDLVHLAKTMVPSLKNENVLITQSCFLPASPDGNPCIGRFPGVENMYLATGHSCWGILLAPATGKAISDLILRREKQLITGTQGRFLSADCPKPFIDEAVFADFNPIRFRLRKKRGRGGQTSDSFWWLDENNQAVDVPLEKRPMKSKMNRNLL